MTRAVAAVRLDTSLKDVAAILAKRGISGVPIVDDDQHVLGVVSEADILTKERGAERSRGLFGLLSAWKGAEAETKLAARTAGDAMTKPAVAIYAHSPVSEAAALMVDRGVNRLPVLGRDGRLIGIVTRADLVRAFTRSDAEIAHEIREEVVRSEFWIPPETIGIEVDDGAVRLTGEVESKQIAELLVAAVGRVLGVVSVRSELTWGADAVTS